MTMNVSAKIARLSPSVYTGRVAGATYRAHANHTGCWIAKVAAVPLQGSAVNAGSNIMQMTLLATMVGTSSGATNLSATTLNNVITLTNATTAHSSTPSERGRRSHTNIPTERTTPLRRRAMPHGTQPAPITFRSTSARSADHST